tara:strand:- start:20973 stop:24050 length:3078 start_codon:yes stop_codon:yes gene_type:complete
MAKNKKIIIGDLWDQQGFKVVSTNLGGVHGRGLAQQAKQKGLITSKNIDFLSSPQNSEVLTIAVKGNAPETAKLSGKAFSESTTGGNVKLLSSEVDKLIAFAKKNPLKRINLPMIGLGFGEGDPKEIKPILERAAKQPNIFLISKDEATAKKYSSSFKPGIRSDKTSFKNVNNAVKNLQNPKPNVVNASDRKGIFIQPPSEIKSWDEATFKKNLTKLYRDAKRKNSDVTVLFRDIGRSKGDRLIREWANEGFTEIEYASGDPKKLQSVRRGYKYKLDPQGKPIIKKSTIKLRPLPSFKDIKDPVLKQKKIKEQLDHWVSQGKVKSISVSGKGKVVLPGELTKPHFERFAELTADRKKGGLGWEKGIEAYLDELDDPSRSIESKLAGIQVIEDKAENYRQNRNPGSKPELFDEPTFDRIRNISRDNPYPIGTFDRMATDIDTGKEFVDTEGKKITFDDGSITRLSKKPQEGKVVDPNTAINRPSSVKLQKGKVKGSRTISFDDYLDSVQTVETVKGTDRILVNVEGIARRETKVEEVKKDLKKSVVNRKGMVKPYDEPDKLVQSYDLAEVETKDVSGSGDKIDQLTVHDPQRTPKEGDALKDKVGEGFDKEDVAIEKEKQGLQSLKKYRRYKDAKRRKEAELDFRIKHKKAGDIYAEDSRTDLGVTAQADKEKKKEQVRQGKTITEVVEKDKPTSITLERQTKGRKDAEIVAKILDDRKARKEGTYEFEGFYKTPAERSGPATVKDANVQLSIDIGKHKGQQVSGKPNVTRLPLGGWVFENKKSKQFTKKDTPVSVPKTKTVNVTTEVTPIKPHSTKKVLWGVPVNVETKRKVVVPANTREFLKKKQAQYISKQVSKKLNQKTPSDKTPSKPSTFGKLEERKPIASPPNLLKDTKKKISDTNQKVPKPNKIKLKGGGAGNTAKWLGRFSLVLAPVLGYSSLKSKKAEASVKNIAQETASVLIGSERVFGSVGNKGYFQNVGLTKKGLSGKRRPGGPIEGAGGKDTPFAKFMAWRKKNQALTQQIKY